MVMVETLTQLQVPVRANIPTLRTHRPCEQGGRSREGGGSRDGSAGLTLCKERGREGLGRKSFRLQYLLGLTPANGDPQTKVVHYRNLVSGRNVKNGLGMNVTEDPKVWQLELSMKYVLCSWSSWFSAAGYLSTAPLLPKFSSQTLSKPDP